MALGGRDERNESSVLLVAGFQVIGHKVADCRPCALQFGFGAQVDDEHVELLVIGRRVCAETFKTRDVGLERVFDVGGVPLRRLGLVKFV